MEEQITPDRSREEGRKVWAALAGQAGEGAGFISAMAGSLLRYLRKNLVSLVLSGLVFAAVGGLYVFLQKRTIRAEMTVSYSQLEKKIYADMLAKLEQLRSGGQFATLAGVLGITENQARGICRIDTRNINNEPLVKDLSTQKVPFYIQVEVSDPALLPVLQDALVKYINEPPYVKGRLKLNEQNYLDEIAMLQRQMHDLDSLKRSLAATKSPDAGTVSGMNNLNKSQNELYGRIRDLRGALQFNRNIEVLDGFVGYQVPLSQRYLRFLALGFAAGVVLRMAINAFR